MDHQLIRGLFARILFDSCKYSYSEVATILGTMKLISLKSSLLVRILKLENLSAKRLLQVTLALSENNFNDKNNLNNSENDGQNVLNIQRDV